MTLGADEANPHAQPRGEGWRLLASAFGGDGGGLFGLGPDGFERLDHLETTGIAVSHDGALLARALRGDPDPQSSGRLLLYDRRGVRWFHRHDDLTDPHGIVWSGPREFVHLSTGANSATWFDADTGRAQRQWVLPGEVDSWHLNCPAVLPTGRVVATAFGRFSSHCEWRSHVRAKEPTGLILEVGTGVVLVEGLSGPHDPFPLDGEWLVCDSARERLLHLSATGAVVAEAAVGSWARGLAVDDDHIYVGASRHRHAGEEGMASVVVFDRRTFAEVARWPLPSEEVFALAWAPETLIQGVMIGSGVPPAPDADRGVSASPLRIDAALPASGLALPVRMHEPIPSEAPAGSWLTARFTLDNEGDQRLISEGELPVRIGARWERDGGFAPEQGRARLPYSVMPGESVGGTILIPVPEQPGRYRLVVAALQESVVWCDALDADRSASAEIEVR